MSEGQGPSLTELKTAERRRIQELSVGVVLGENKGESSRDKARVAKAREHLQVGKWESTLQDMEQTSEEVSGRLRGIVEKFGVNRKSDGEKERKGKESERFDRAEKALKTITTFIEKGYDGLDDDQKDMVRVQIERAFLQHGAIGQEFVGLDDNKKKIIIEQMLKEPNFAKHMRTSLQKAAGHTLTAEEDIRKARKESAEASSTGTKTSRAQEAVDRAKARLEAAGRGEMTGKAKGIEAQIAAAQGKATIIEGELASLNQEKERRLDYFEGKTRDEVTEVESTEYQKLLTSIEKKQQELKQKKESIESLNQLLVNTIPDEKELEDRLRDAQDRLEAANKADDGKDLDPEEKKAHERELIEQRAHEEAVIVASLETAFLRAAQGKLNEDLKLAYKAMEVENASVDDDIKNKAKANLRKAFESRWMKTVTRHTALGRQRNEQKVNLQQVNADFQAIMENGPDAVLQSVLEETKRTRFGRTRGGRIFDNAEVDVIMADKDLVKDMKQELIKYVVSNTLLSRKFSPAEVHQLVESSWGGDAIDVAITKNADFRSKLEALNEGGDVDLAEATFKDRFKREAKKSPLLLFSVIGTIPWLATALGRATWRTVMDDDRKHLSSQLAA